MGGADTERPPKGEPVWVVAVRLLAYEMEPGRGQDSAPHPPPWCGPSLSTHRAVAVSHEQLSTDLLPDCPASWRCGGCTPPRTLQKEDRSTRWNTTDVPSVWHQSTRCCNPAPHTPPCLTGFC